MESLKKFDNLYFTVGRTLLGLYFIVPGASKIFDFMGTLTLMRLKGVPLSSVLLPLTIVVQIIGGMFLILNKHLRISALLLFGLTILINIYIHNFWSLAGDPSQGHDMQNFIKKLAIAAGLLILATKEKDKN